jgi:hypothetical protein
MTDLLLEEMDKNNQVNPYAYFQFYVTNIIWFICSGNTTDTLDDPFIKGIFETNMSVEKALSIESNLKDFVPLVAPFYDSVETQRENDRVFVEVRLPLYNKMVRESTKTEPPNLVQVLQREFTQKEVVAVLGMWTPE